MRDFDIEDKEYDFKEYQKKRLLDEMILKDVVESYLEGRPSKYTEEQIVCAQKEQGKEEMNSLFNQFVFPLSNSIIFVIYYLLSLISLPFVYLNSNKNIIIAAIMSLFALLAAFIVVKIINWQVQKKRCRKRFWMNCLERFSLHTSIITSMLTSIGYMLTILDTLTFLLIYTFMLLLFLIAVYYEIIKPLIINYIKQI